MASTSSDLYILEFTMPEVFATSFYPPLTSRLIAEGIHHSTIFSGWGQRDGQSNILCTISFSVPKNSKTDAQIITLGNDCSVILGTPLLTINKSATETLFTGG